MKHLIVILLLVATPIWACPNTVILDDPKSELLAELAVAQDQKTARKVADKLWKQFQTAPDKQSQEWLDEALSRIRLSDFERARTILDELITYCPSYAEGYNQLAFTYFLTEDYEKARIFLNKTLEREPSHFGALAGMGLVAHAKGNLALAKIWIRKALLVHPFLNERHILNIPDENDKI